MEEMGNCLEYQWDKGIVEILYDHLEHTIDNVLLIYDMDATSGDVYLHEFISMVEEKLTHITKVQLSRYSTMEEVDNVLGLCKTEMVDSIYAIGDNDVLECAKYISLVANDEHEICDMLFDNEEICHQIPILLFKVDTNICYKNLH